MDQLKALIGKVATGAALTRDEAASAFDVMMSGEATPSQMGGLLMALRVRGETVDEITGAVATMRAKMLKVSAQPMRSTSLGPEETRRAPTIFPPAPPLSLPARAYLSPSTEIARSPRGPGRPTCWPRSGCASI